MNLPLIERYPILSGILGTVTGFGASATAILQSANVVLAFIAGLFGAITAVFTCLIAIRRWHRGFKLEQARSISKARRRF